LNVAVTAVLAFIVTVQSPVPVQAPLQPANTLLPVTRAVSVTTVPLVNALPHVLPQLMPAGLLVTVPCELAEPFLVTVSVNVVPPPVTVNGSALDTDPSGFATVTCAVPAAAMSADPIVAVS
jgi:hypothetical protein